MIADLEKQMEKLGEPFPPAVIKKNPKNMDYVPVAEVIARLNFVLGPQNWSHKIVETIKDGVIETSTGVYPKWITSRVEVIVVWADGSVSSHEGMGGQEVQFLKSNAGPVDIGDTYKGASSDAFKKACQGFGVALDLARSEEAMQQEARDKSADEPKANPKTCQEIIDHVSKFEKDSKERKDFAAWWNKKTGGKKLTDGEVTLREANEALEFLGIGAPSS